MDQASSADDSGITLRIKFKSESVDQFIARYGSDVSPGGIFIRTREPLGVGTNIRFEFSLAEGQALLVGQGTVVWVREHDQSRAGVVPGMGVRFDKLTAHSQNVLGTILAGKARRDRSDGGRVSSGRPTPQAGSPIPQAAQPPLVAAAPERPRAPSVKVAPLSRLQHAMEEANGTSDPWQSDKTEIAPSPTFSSEPPSRTSEELSLAGPLDTDLGAPPLPPASVASRRMTPALGSDRPPSANRETARSAPIPLINGPGRGVPTPVLGSATSPLAMTGRPSATVQPLGESFDQAVHDAVLEHTSSATMNLRVPGRARALAVIGIAAAAAAAAGYLFVQKRLASEAAAPVASSPIAAPAPAPPPPRVVPAPPPVPPPPAAAVDKPVPAAPPPAAAAVAPPTPAPPAAVPPPPAVASPEPAVRTARAAKRPRRARPAIEPSVAAVEPSDDSAAANTAAAAAPSASGDDQPSAAGEEIYWLKVNSTPKGAEVLIDGQLEGRTPFQRRILDTSRPYAVTVRKPGFEAHEQMLSASDEWVKKGNVRTLTINARLPKSKGGADQAEGEGDKAAPTEPAATEPAATEPPPANPPAQP